MKKVLIGLGVLIVLAGVGAGGAFMWMEKAVATAIGPADAPDVEFTVAKGTTARGLGPQLVQAGLIKDTNTWRFFLWRRGGSSSSAAGG